MSSAATLDRIDDRVFDALSEPPRRSAFRVVADRDELFTVPRLARAIRAAGPEPPGGEGGSDRGRLSLLQLRVALHHVHLPKLDDAGLVSYDRSERVVAPAYDDTAVLERARAVLSTDDDPRSDAAWTDGGGAASAGDEPPPGDGRSRSARRTGE
jgi:DNA-binding transcriptional ArsR family regulator